MSEADAEWEHYVRNSSIMSGPPVRKPSERAPVLIPVRPQIWNGPLKRLVWLPLAWFGFNTVVGFAAGFWWWIILMTVALASAVSVVLAGRDQELLRVAGYEAQASPRLAVFPIAYLAKRGSAMWESNTAAYRPLWVHLSLLIVMVATTVAALFVLEVAIMLAEAHG